MLEKKAAGTIEKYGMLDRGDKVAVSVSGGPDSLALLLFLEELAEPMDLKLHVFHLDHMIRGEESGKEAEFVENICRSKGFPVEVARENVGKLAAGSKLSKQHFAREVRLTRLNEYANRIGADKIAIGHNADDQVETFLMRIIQGAGMTGLSGISPVSGKIIRPLIETWRSEIDSYLERKDATPVIDSSNLEDIYLRNRIRHHLVPFLESEFGSGIKPVILREVDSLAVDYEFMRERVEDAFDGVARVSGGSAVIDIDGLMSLHPSVRRGVIREAWFRVRPGCGSLLWQHVDDILEKVAGGRTGVSIELPDGYTAEREYGDLLIHVPVVEQPSLKRGSLFLDVPGLVESSDWRFTVVAEEVNAGDMEFNRERHLEYITADIELPLELRKPYPGDRFWPIGSAGMKKLKDYFIDIKLPRRERRRCMLLVSSGSIVWVVGYRLDERFKVRPNDKTAIKLELLPLLE